METKFLLPNRFKLIGWFILIPSAILGIISCQSLYDFDWLTFDVTVPVGGSANDFFGVGFFVSNHIQFSNTIFGILSIVGGLLVAFSREKIEDEYVTKLRLRSFQWAVFINYVILLLCFLLVYSVGFLSVMAYNMFTVILLFIIRFNYLLHRNEK